MKKFLIFIWEIAKIVIISLAIIIPIRYYLIQPFFVRGASMEPNFDNGQYLVIDEISYRFEEPARGEVVVFKYPLDPSQYYIKRIIGLPGETVEIKDGQVFIYNQEFPQGMVLDESAYLPEGKITRGELRVKLNQGEYFVLGDNRQASSDSRQWGALSREYIIGRVWLRAWPFDAARVY
jgi:signal peptidase I